MVKAHLTKGDYDERLRQLAGEVALRAIYDIRLLQRRKVLVGFKIDNTRLRSLTDCNCYRKVSEIKRLLSDFKSGVVLFWCKASGITIDQSTLNRLIKRKEYGISEICA